MRGTRAKKLRKLAMAICTDVLDVKPGEGFNDYHQQDNCRGWAPALDGAGKVMYDGDGIALKQLTHTLPGTITCAYRLRVIYQALKRRYKNGDKGSIIPGLGYSSSGAVQPT
jgi:hypothetical protein